MKLEEGKQLVIFQGYYNRPIEATQEREFLNKTPIQKKLHEKVLRRLHVCRRRKVIIMLCICKGLFDGMSVYFPKKPLSACFSALMWVAEAAPTVAGSHTSMPPF